MILYILPIVLLIFSHFFLKGKTNWEKFLVFYLSIFFCSGYMTGSDWRGYEEMYNLIADPDKQDIAKQMSAAIYDWLEETNGMQIPLKRTVKYRFGDFKHKNEH